MNHREPSRLIFSLRSSVRLVAVGLAVMVVLAGCGPGKNGDTGGEKPAPVIGPGGEVIQPISLVRENHVPVDSFIADKEIDPKTHQVKGPLLAYSLSMEALLDKTETFQPRTGKLSAVTVVFGLPKTSGDTGRAYRVALERAAEIFAGTPDEGKVLTEVVEEGTIALVRIESLGFPSGHAADTQIPVSIAPVGNAVDITGGHIYATGLRCERTKEVLAMHPFGHFEADEVEEYSITMRRPWDFDEVYEPKKPKAETPVDDPLKPRPSHVETAEGLVFRRWLLREGFRMLRKTTWHEIGREELRFTVGGFKYDQDGNPMPTAAVDEEIVEAVVRAFENPKLKLHVERDPVHRTRILVVPSVRKQGLDELYDWLRVQRVEIRPRRMLHIIADNNNGRIILAGPERDRKLAGTLRFASHVSDKGSAFVSSGFRLVATPTDQGRKLSVRWAQLRTEKAPLREGEAEIANDLGDLLRFVYSNGCGPDDCFLITEQAKRDRLVDAQLSLFPARIKPRIAGDEGG